jgi:ABC-2 type transport system permease protein
MRLFRDTWLVFQRQMLIALRTPVWVAIGLFQPLAFLLLFAPLLDNIAKAPGFPPGGSLGVFTPGLLILQGMYGAAFVGFALVSDLREGIIERQRVTPVSRLALPLGRTLRDVVVTTTQGIILVLVAWIMGLKLQIPGILSAFVLLALLVIALSSASYALALMVTSEDALAPVINFVLLPVQLLSGVMLPLALAPLWIQNVAKANPLAYAVDASRWLFNGGALSDAVVLKAFVAIGIIVVLGVWWAVSAFRQATA